MKSVFLILSVLLGLALTGCNGYLPLQGDTGAPGAPGTPGEPGLDAPPTPPAPLPPAPTAAQIEQSKIDNIVFEENTYRYNNLSAQLTKGLDCTLSKTQFTGAISILGSGSNGLGTLTTVVRYPYTGYFAHDDGNQANGLSFVPSPYRTQPANTSEVYVRCTGTLVVTKTQLHSFEFRSDDNLVLTINGVQITTPAVDDINHGANPMTGKILSLKDGQIVNVDVRYRQFNGQSTLQLLQNGGWLEPKYLFH